MTDLPRAGDVQGAVGGVGAAAGVGACGVSEAAAVGGGWAGVRLHPGGAGAVRGGAGDADVQERDRDLPDQPAGVLDCGGDALRIVDTARFKVVYSTDNWATNTTMESHPVGYAGSYADIATVAGQAGTIVFTFYWPGQDKWLGRNFEVAVEVE